MAAPSERQAVGAHDDDVRVGEEANEPTEEAPATAPTIAPITGAMTPVGLRPARAALAGIDLLAWRAIPCAAPDELSSSRECS